ncbi:hypothetical protein AJ80_00885 [Polytolypa hystricis UAMH7299]|uniref:HIT domain-containing protein n=1 Tax=Polytolypa hystricis (strain UAMH7299) TaxID=1447883 RepID=A0A2B7Z3L2_POLH7|nr:hypothetical protein AJ80_00885 [Polytolypa hystricis UAMH7299]
MSSPSPSPSPTCPCPFCAIASSHPPLPPSSLPTEKPGNTAIEVRKISDPPQTYLILSTKHVLAFLDIMPLTRGHVLVVPRDHYEKIGDVGVRIGAELGKWLPILSRVVVRTVLGQGPDARGEDPGNWNVVQNNGARAAQVVPHVHFHIIPRPPLNSTAPLSPPTKGGWIMFGRGQRQELDDDEAKELVRELRVELSKEVQRVKEEEGVDLDLDGVSDGGDVVRRMERL